MTGSRLLWWSWSWSDHQAQPNARKCGHEIVVPAAECTALTQQTIAAQCYSTAFCRRNRVSPDNHKLDFIYSMPSMAAKVFNKLGTTMGTAIATMPE